MNKAINVVAGMLATIIIVLFMAGLFHLFWNNVIVHLPDSPSRVTFTHSILVASFYTLVLAGINELAQHYLLRSKKSHENKGRNL